MLSLCAATLPNLVGCDRSPGTPTSAVDAYPQSVPVKQGSPNQLDTDLAAFLHNPTHFIGKRVQFPINSGQLTFVEQRQLDPTDDGASLYVYNLGLGTQGVSVRVFSARDLDGAAAISGTWSAFGSTNFLSAETILMQRIENGDTSWLWKSLSALPSPTGEPQSSQPARP